MIEQIFFYMFSAVLLVSACMVITARNPVHSVLFLILAFLNAAALFVMAGAAFLAMVLVIVYVGAVAVLFLFVVMMLDVDFIALREGFQKFLPLGLTVGFVLMAEIGLSLAGFEASGTMRLAAATHRVAGLSDAAAIGDLLYTRYLYVFELAGLLLVIAMIGAIVLTLTEGARPRRQDLARQHDRAIADTLSLVKPVIGAGIAPLPARENVP
jgi:NADH-quinone oxidoreductase subunit J